MRCWTFYRRSTDRQELSIEDQRKACEAFARERGWAILREFTPPKGYASGLSIEQDAAFQEMVRLVEKSASGADALLIYDVSRLGRLPPKRKFYWEEHFRRHGVTVVYAAEPFQNDGSLGDEIHQFVSHSEAHQYSLRLSKSSIRGSKSHAALGRSCGGRPPFGYARQLVDAQGNAVGVLAAGQHKAEKTQHVVWAVGEAVEVELVRGLFEAYARGKGLGAIVEDLNGRGVPSPRGGAWAKNSVQAILKNPAYIGRRVYFKHAYHDRTGRGKHVRMPDEWTVAEGAHPALVERELWERVQARFRVNRPRDGRHQDSPHLLSGFVRCARCGHRYYAQKKRGGVYYVCGGYHTKGKTFCSSYSVQAAALERAILEQIEKRTAELLREGAFLARLRALVEAARGPDAQRRGEDLTAALAAKDQELRNVVAAIKAAGGSPTLVAELKRLEAERAALAGHVAAAAPAQAMDLEAEALALVEQIRDLPGLLAEGSAQERRAVIGEFLASVDISPDDAEARLHFRALPFLPKEEAAPQKEDGFHRDRCGGPILPLWPLPGYDTIRIPLGARVL